MLTAPDDQTLADLYVRGTMVDSLRDSLAYLLRHTDPASQTIGWAQDQYTRLRDRILDTLPNHSRDEPDVTQWAPALATNADGASVFAAAAALAAYVDAYLGAPTWVKTYHVRQAQLSSATHALGGDELGGTKGLTAGPREQPGQYL